MSSGNPVMMFVVKALFCVVEADESLEPVEVEGLKHILDSIVIDGREGHE